MKYICTLMLALGVLYFTSCTSSNSNINVTPVADSASKGGNFQISFVNQTSSPESFYLNDYTSNGTPVIMLYANILYDHSDSLYKLTLELADEKRTNVSVIFSGTNTSATGNYTNNDNTSTVIDYTGGLNVTYSILTASTVNITQSSYPIQGSFTFNLNHNYFTTTATGSFFIYK